MLAQLTSSHVDLADVLYLVAFILFAVHVVLALVRKSVAPLDLLGCGLACLALAFFVL